MFAYLFFDVWDPYYCIIITIIFHVTLMNEQLFYYVKVQGDVRKMFCTKKVPEKLNQWISTPWYEFGFVE